jgi:hypothetical protein
MTIVWFPSAYFCRSRLDASGCRREGAFEVRPESHPDLDELIVDASANGIDGSIFRFMSIPKAPSVATVERSD